MKERPILFSAPMVLALLSDRKTQTRRTVKPQPHNADSLWSTECPYGIPGDRLRVKESTWLWCERRPNGNTKTGRQKWHYVPLEAAPHFYCADMPEKPSLVVSSPRTGNQWGWRKKVARFMPRWASRITLEITAVRVQRLQDISAEDAKAEGVGPCQPPMHFDCPEVDKLAEESRWRGGYQRLWESINGKGSWDTNPWVWALTFKRVEQFNN